MYLYPSAIREPFVLSIESSVAVVVAVARERCGGTFFRARLILFFSFWCWQDFFFFWNRRQFSLSSFLVEVKGVWVFSSLSSLPFWKECFNRPKTTKKEYKTTHQCQLLSRDRRRSSSREDSSPRGRRRLKEERAPRSRAPRLLLPLFLHTERRHHY